DVVATYSGTDVLKGVASDPSAFTVAKAASTTGLLVSETSPFTGQVVQLLTKVTGPDDAAMTTGQVAFASAGTAIPGCSAVAVTDEGYASCSTSWSARGTYAVTAAYAGTDQIAGSTSSATSVVAGADATVRAQAATGTYGSKGATLAGEVQGSGRVATGTVTLSSGSTVLGTATLVGGRWSLALGATAVLPGTRTVTATYSGDARHHPGTDSASLTITKAKPAMALSVTPSAPKIGTRAVASVTVTAPGLVPTGTVKIQMNGRTLATVTLVDGKGTATLPAFGGRGTKAFTAVYSGSSRIGTGTSATKTLVVR
ncbi:MAG: hypothetical protein JWO77_2774, partial [Ilumatobacteraceae bacterium]|nr:hypothetical protein [Ilumatobacteraceae bacterium]